ncbi:GSK3-beta interaction protein-like [Rhopalosiphum maidis]|uniref:GSK3-beta interaction protein-like n=1 Tax=Rhopalosiphum maidis TaxID=43146 RepID=UPI000EFDD1AE|nr:GSK3-beta interaction protein-like [Rhopalosiphum maidis]
MEKPLDWYTEAKSVIESELSLLNHISISPLIVTDGVYLNIETLENQQFCVLLNKQGFRVVAKAFDQDTNNSQLCYETHFALLSNISKGYCQRFNELVAVKLNEVAGSCKDKDNQIEKS